MSPETAWHVLWTISGVPIPSSPFRESRIDRAAYKFNENERLKLSNYLRKLWELDGDRLVGGQGLLALHVGQVSVQLLISCASDKVSQYVGRCKSKMSSKGIVHAQPHLWSKSFWKREVISALAIQTVASRIQSL